VAGGWRIPHNEELHNLYTSTILLGQSNLQVWRHWGISTPAPCA